ncbi:SGNH/GDSL hydrolase family protein [Engelhardtia mirabilis]|uniref:SGNH hydrolase-type esterase domain-containing protein n=1 Tax=Engelhardtia mirabilis TaxID=2528011 RepID=A0A518BLR5_9BACT|nr:hypothetical protein Pla133_30070 [Planctomycetes bacterium Pla133]QDV02244.1 hypothetical protein Pla86_30060 [Planctomycetes bacterium Pla86]
MADPQPQAARRGSAPKGALLVLLGLVLGFAGGWYARGPVDGSQVPAWLEVVDHLPPAGSRPALLPRFAGEKPLAVFRDGSTSTLVADGASYFRRPAWTERRIPWPEHDRGEFVVEADFRGLRLTGPLPGERPEPLIVLVGDSHMEGVCSNGETAAAFLERALARDPAAEGARVLNAATGMYTFPHYLGTAWRYLQLAPDVFVLVVFGGNDFGALETDEAELRGDPKPLRPPGYNERLVRALEVQVAGREAGPSLWQFLNQELLFTVDPPRLEWALARSLEYVEAIQRLADEVGTRLVVAYVPPVSDVHPEVVGPVYAPLLSVLELEDADLKATERLADRFLAALGARGVETLDARPALRGATEPCYWIADEHLNVAGLRVLGEALAERLAGSAQ